MRTLKLLAAVAVVFVILGGCLLLPCAREGGIREIDARMTSGFRIKGIGRALHDYHAVHKKLPPAVIRDKDGKPLYSWRVALLPFLEQDALYWRLHLDEPWDNPHNKGLLEPTPPCYALGWPEEPPGTTCYQVFTGPGTAFERDGLTWKDFPNGTSNTILVIEAGAAVPWTKPADLVYDPNGPLPPLGAGYSLPAKFICYEVGRRPVTNACLADGSGQLITDTMDEQTIRSLITRNGGKPVDR